MTDYATLTRLASLMQTLRDTPVLWKETSDLHFEVAMRTQQQLSHVNKCTELQEESVCRSKKKTFSIQIKCEKVLLSQLSSIKIANTLTPRCLSPSW